MSDIPIHEVSSLPEHTPWNPGDKGPRQLALEALIDAISEINDAIPEDDDDYLDVDRMSSAIMCMERAQEILTQPACLHCLISVTIKEWLVQHGRAQIEKMFSDLPTWPVEQRRTALMAVHLGSVASEIILVGWLLGGDNGEASIRTTLNAQVDKTLEAHKARYAGMNEAERAGELYRRMAMDALRASAPASETPS